MTRQRFTCRTGTLDYLLYTPKGSLRRRLPVVVMLHGCMQSASQFAAATDMNALADELGFLVLYPEQSVTANLARCWNWHRPENQRRGGGEAAVIAALTRKVIRTCKGDATRVYIAGLSAGGAAAAIIAAAYPQLFAAAGVHSGVPRGNVTCLGGALAAMRGGASSPLKGRAPRHPVPTIVFHGDRDNTVHPSNTDGFLHGLQRSGPALTVVRTVPERTRGARAHTKSVYRRGLGAPVLEEWIVHGAGHAWFGGSARGTYSDTAGPNASREMLRFFFSRRLAPPRAKQKADPGRR